MRELKHFKSVDFAVATKTPGNREGKGANGFLTDWHSSAPRGVVAKPRRQLLAELFTSISSGRWQSKLSLLDRWRVVPEPHRTWRLVARKTRWIRRNVCAAAGYDLDNISVRSTGRRESSVRRDQAIL